MGRMSRPAARCAPALVPLLVMAASLAGCARNALERPRYAYSPEAFSAALEARVPGISPALAEAPFVVDEQTVNRARDVMARLPRGPERMQALVDFLNAPEPEGLGLRYDWQATGDAETTLARRRGNCVSLASVLVGLGRGLGWPVYYAEVRARTPETKEFEGVRALSDHMAVLITPRSAQMLVDFTGLIDRIESVQIIDDLTAYAHILNNLSAEHVLRVDSSPEPAAWTRALAGFGLATQVQPELGRAWDNMGRAVTRRGRVEEPRAAYGRAVELDTAFGSPERNLTVMETRATGKTAILEKAAPE